MIKADEKVQINKLVNIIKDNPFLLTAFRDDPFITVISLLPDDLTEEQAAAIVSGVRAKLESNGPSKHTDDNMDNFLGT